MKKISLLMILVIMSTFILLGCGGDKCIEGTKLRYDGVYQSTIKDADGECSYVCFYEDGKAATLQDSSIDSPEKAYEEFHNGSIKAHHSTTFKTSSGVIVEKKKNGTKDVKKAPDAVFTIQVNTGTTTYEVYAQKKYGIRCNINGALGTTTDKYYNFVEVD